ncbi:MAG: hypothetical protein ACM3VS_18995 [Candidatus Dadabacteria bacterium]
MKRLLPVLIFFFYSCSLYSQKLKQVSFLDGYNLTFFTVSTDQDVLIRIAPDGRLMEWGTELLSDRGNYYAPNLQPFMGRVEYYGDESDVYFKGKVKSIGSAYFTYYGPQEDEAKRGKVKSIGHLDFDYYSRFDEKAMQGKLKMIGMYLLDYYRSYENKAVKEKLKSIGSMAVNYYGFEDKNNEGKLKSVGTATFTWYTPFDYIKSGLKSNNYRQSVGDITVVLR